MATEIILPRVDMDMTTGQISRWFFKDGDRIEKGQPLFEIETDKAAMEIESSVSGILKQPAATGQSIAVGSIVGWIASIDEKFIAPVVSDHSPDIVLQLPTELDPPVRASEPVSIDTVTDHNALRATPLARQLGRLHAVNLKNISGTGPLGRVQGTDVSSYLEDLSVKPARANAIYTSDAPLHGTFLRQGEGDPLVLIHGFGSDLNSWRLLAQTLGNKRPIFAVDLPGHGQSPWRTYASIGAVVEAVVACLEVNKISMMHMIGHSLGAAVAAFATRSLQGSVKSLFLISPAGLGPDINSDFIDGFCRSRNESSLRSWMELLVADPLVLTDPLVRATAASRASGQVAATQKALADLAFVDGTQAFSIRPVLNRLSIPTRIVMGRADRIIPVQHMADLPGHVALHLLNGVGHMPHIEANELLARLIKDHMG